MTKMKMKILLTLTLLLTFAMPVMAQPAPEPAATETIRTALEAPKLEPVADRVTAAPAAPGLTSLALRPNASASVSTETSVSTPQGVTVTTKSEARDIMAEILKGIAALLGTVLTLGIRSLAQYLRAQSDLAIVQAGVGAVEEAGIAAVNTKWEEKSKYLIERWQKKEITPDDYDIGMKETGAEAWALAKKILGGAADKLKPRLGDVEALLRSKMEAHLSKLKKEAEELFSRGK